MSAVLNWPCLKSIQFRGRAHLRRHVYGLGKARLGVQALGAHELGLAPSPEHNERERVVAVI